MILENNTIDTYQKLNYLSIDVHYLLNNHLMIYRFIIIFTSK